ncbi:MAG TPA: hypothetical protein VHS13_07320, partial [Edaphobacter sp.]|nr:hypothetical protein [Edaphobacter sp.]
MKSLTIGMTLASLIATPVLAARQHLSRHDYTAGYQVKQADQQLKPQWHHSPTPPGRNINRM